MKFLPLVWAGFWRRPARSLLTAICIVIAFLLLGLLEGVNAGFAKAIADAHRDFLVTDTRVRGGAPFPIAAMATIQNISGIKEVVPRAYFTGTYREPKNGVAAIATDIDGWFDIRPAFFSEKQYLAAMHTNRAGMLVTPPVLPALDWHVGDTVVLHSSLLKSDGTADWTFKIVGTFDSIENPNTAQFALINYDYLDEYRVKDRGTAERFYIRIADPTKAISTAAAIDRIFENSAHETRTRSDQERAESTAKQMGDIAFFTNSIMAAVLFTLALITANTLRQSIQERVREFAVLKAMGYGDNRVTCIAFGEALLLYLPAGVFGLVIAAITAPLVKESIGVIVVSTRVTLLGLGCAIVLALISVALPAWNLARLPIVQSFGKR